MSGASDSAECNSAARTDSKSKSVFLANPRLMFAISQSDNKRALPLELKEMARPLQRLLIRRPANSLLSNPLPSGSGRGRLDDQKR